MKDGNVKKLLEKFQRKVLKEKKEINSRNEKDKRWQQIVKETDVRNEIMSVGPERRKVLIKKETELPKKPGIFNSFERHPERIIMLGGKQKVEKLTENEVGKEKATIGNLVA